MPHAFICDTIRTPFGRYGGALATLRPDDLAAIPLRALLARNPTLDPAAIDDVILGCAASYNPHSCLNHLVVALVATDSRVNRRGVVSLSGECRAAN